MNQFFFTNFSRKKFLALPPDVQERIRNKIEELQSHTALLRLLKPLKDFAPATHRLRIGDYRLILGVDKRKFFILDVGHRRDIYL